MNTQSKYPLILTIVYRLVPIIYPLALLHWKIFRPKTTGVKVILRYRDQILLLINTSVLENGAYQVGGVLNGESLLDAAKRETFEEVGIRVEELNSHGSFFFDGLGKRDTIWVYSTQVRSQDFHLQSEEISDGRWFSLRALPKTSSVVLAKSLQLAKLSPVK